MRQDVTFSSNGMSCAGWLYVPEDLQEGEERPTIVMAHGFSAVKEMYLANFAEKFEEAGFVVLVFDYRYFGDSEGEPRGRLIPAEQHEDYKNAITWISQRAEVDPDRIGIGGSSYCGGNSCIWHPWTSASRQPLRKYRWSTVGGTPRGLCARTSSTNFWLRSLRIERSATRKVRAPACPSWLPRENLRRCRHPNLTSGLTMRAKP